MSEEQSTEDWLRRVELEVDRALVARPPDFGALVQALASIDPLVVADVLRRREEQGSAPATALLASASALRNDHPVSPRPIAHPLEYDWRFTDDTAAKLVGRLDGATRDGDTIGYLGAPAAFALAVNKLPRCRHVLLDMSKRWVSATSDAARIISIDLLRDPLPTLELHAAILDPPWYPEYHAAFLWATGSLLRPSGLVLASFPPLAMRPRVATERKEILRNAVRAGLVVEDVEALALRYATPPFERAAFAAAGISLVPDAWRRGDMLILRKSHDSVAKRPSPPSGHPEWEVIEIEEIPLAVRKLDRNPDVATALLEPAVPGVTLPSVSRRDSARSGAVLWSSRNRIYKSSAPTVLRVVVRSLRDRCDAVAAAEDVLGRRLTAAEEENVVATANQLSDLIQTERKEHGFG